MSDSVAVRGLVLGQGRPKVCVPLMGATAAELAEEAAAARIAGADLAEWRADYFSALQGDLRPVLEKLRRALGELPLLFTVRTRGEGGESGFSTAAYRVLLREVISTGLVDLVDVELFCGETACRELVRAAHAGGAAVVMSSHDFAKTPPAGELVARMCAMSALEADVLKLAVMPRRPEDVLALLGATQEMARRGVGPVITMAMGGLGAISRVSGEFFHSAVTFGCTAKPSAPGQLPVESLCAILDALHHSLEQV